MSTDLGKLCKFLMTAFVLLGLSLNNKVSAHNAYLLRGIVLSSLVKFVFVEKGKI